MNIHPVKVESVAAKFDVFYKITLATTQFSVTDLAIVVTTLFWRKAGGEASSPGMQNLSLSKISAMRDLTLSTP